jgi:hypothetical protein
MAKQGRKSIELTREQLEYLVELFNSGITKKCIAERFKDRYERIGITTLQKHYKQCKYFLL